jgi:thioester reductase-like protein
MRLLVAGITGQLGAGLIEADDRTLFELVPLVRPMVGRSARDRVRSLDLERPDLAAAAVEGDVTAPGWGLDRATIRRLAIDVDCVLDLAAVTNWAAGRSQLDAVNVRGAVHGYELTRELEVAAGSRKLYCYASSIHAAGGAEGLIGEVPFRPDEHRTPYELSKWVAETTLLSRARRAEGPALCIARVGGLIGSSATTVTRRRNSLYMLADRFDELPLGLLPLAPGGRVDMLPRDVASRLLLDTLLALHAEPAAEPEIVHVCAGESAPLTSAVLATLASIDVAERRRRPLRLPVPVAAILAASEQLTRYLSVSVAWHNALVGLRYLSLDRLFERSRSAALTNRPLPCISIEELVRCAFELPAAPSPPNPGPSSLARFAG